MVSSLTRYTKSTKAEPILSAAPHQGPKRHPFPNTRFAEGLGNPQRTIGEVQGVRFELTDSYETRTST